MTQVLTKPCGDFKEGYILITDSQEIATIMSYVKPEDRDDFGSLFVKAENGEYTECWGSSYSVPWRNIIYYRVPLAF